MLIIINSRKTQSSISVGSIPVKPIYDDSTTHSTTTEVIEITICVRFTAIRLRYDYDEKLTCSFFAGVEWKQARAIRRSRMVVGS